MTRVLKWGLILFILVCGCAGSHSAGEPVSGVYDLVVTDVDDSCTPARLDRVLELSVAVFAKKAEALYGLSVPIPLWEMPAWGLGLSREIFMTPDYKVHSRIAPYHMNCPSSYLDQTWWLMELRRESFTMEKTESWQVVSGCTEESDLVVYPTPPTADCAAKIEFHYELMEECEKPTCDLFSDNSCTCERI